MFDYRKLEAFCRVYEQRSFSRAGEVLFLSQPTVSAHVQALEKEIGVKLLDRMGRTVLPTPAGSVLYRHSVNAFGELSAAKNEISRLMGDIAGNVSLGASTIPAAYLLPEIVTAFVAKYPMVHLNLSVSDSHWITRSVLEGECMLGIVGSADKHQDLEFVNLIDDELVIVVSSESSAIPAKPEYSMAEAAEWPWIMREEGSGTRKNFEDGIIKAGYSPRALQVVLHVDSTQVAVQYAISGLGVTVTSRLVVAAELERGKLRELKISGLKLPRSFYAVTNIRRDFFPAAASFLSFLQDKTAHLRQL